MKSNILKIFPFVTEGNVLSPVPGYLVHMHMSLRRQNEFNSMGQVDKAIKHAWGPY
jgi:hypothetical protein